MRSSVTIKELHAHTGALVRRAAKSPLQVTDRGQLVAVLGSPSLFPTRKRQRRILPEYAALLRRRKSTDVLADLDAVRGDR